MKLLFSSWCHLFIYGDIKIVHDTKNGIHPDLDNCRTMNDGIHLLGTGNVFGSNSISSDIMKLLHMVMNNVRLDIKTGTWKRIVLSNII